MLRENNGKMLATPEQANCLDRQNEKKKNRVESSSNKQRMNDNMLTTTASINTHSFRAIQWEA